MVARTVIVVAGGLAVAALAYVAYRKATGQGGFQSLGHTVGVIGSTAMLDLAGGVLTGAVETVGEAVGVPKTNLTKCEQDKAAGRTWDASFSCPAADFLNYVWN